MVTHASPARTCDSLLLTTLPLPRSPTLEFDVFLDAFFLFEILYTFFVGIELKGVRALISSFYHYHALGLDI